MTKAFFRKGLQPATAHAALQAAAVMAGHVYRTADPSAAARIVNLASAILDEIEMREAAAKAQD